MEQMIVNQDCGCFLLSHVWSALKFAILVAAQSIEDLQVSLLVVDMLQT